MLKKTLLLLVISLTSLGLNAQKQVLNDVLRAKTKGTGPIVKDNTVMGYFSFYELDKKDKKSRNYQLNIFDQNLSALSSKKFSSQENLTALEASFDGELLMIKYLDDKNDKFVFTTYDQNANQVNSKSIDAKKVYNPYAALANAEETEDKTLTAIEGKGFLHFVVKLRGGPTSHTYNEVTFFPEDKTAKSWTWTTPESSEDFEFGDVLGSNGTIVMCLANKRARLMSQDVEDFVFAIDLKTGKKLYEIPLEDKKYAVSTLNTLVDASGNFQIFGLYFEKEAKTAKAKSLGLFSFSVDSLGKISSRKYQSWEKDIAKFLKVNDKGKIKDIGYLYFHKFVKTADNKIFAIGEQYNTNVGASVALSLLTRQTTSTFNIEDMYIFEFTEAFDLKDVSIFDKTRSSYTFGVIPIGNRATGLFLDYTKSFDYAFTQQSKDKSKFSVGYVDYSKEKGERGYYFGSINYDGAKLKVDKIKFDKKATWEHIYPGKSGYVMISSYFQKEKRLEFRMEKLNF